MNRIKIIISILCLTMATVVFSCKEDELIGCECLPYTYKIKLLKNSSDNISDEDIYIIFRGERYNIATTKPEEPFLEKTDHMLAMNYGAYYISKSLENAEIHFGETDLLHSLNKPKAVVELHIGAKSLNLAVEYNENTERVDLYLDGRHVGRGHGAYFQINY